MKTIKFLIILLLVQWGDKTFAQDWDIIMMYRNQNPIILDSNWYEKSDQFTLFDFGLKSRDGKAWFLTDIDLKDIPKGEQGLEIGKEEISIYDLRNFTCYKNGEVTNYQDSISPPPFSQSIDMNHGIFLAGTGYKVTASLPKEKRGVFTFKATLRAHMESNYPVWDTFCFIQTIYVGVDAPKLSVKENSIFDKINIAQSADFIKITNIQTEKMEIFSMKGEKVYGNPSYTDGEIIETRNLSPGIYTIVIGDGIYRKKFAITH